MEVQQFKQVIADLQKSSYSGSVAHEDQIGMFFLFRTHIFKPV